MKTIEVYKTNVQNSYRVNSLYMRFTGSSLSILPILIYTTVINFKSGKQRVEIEDENIISLMLAFGFMAEPLPD